MTAEEWRLLDADPRVTISESGSFLDAEPGDES